MCVICQKPLTGRRRKLCGDLVCFSRRKAQYDADHYRRNADRIKTKVASYYRANRDAVNERKRGRAKSDPAQGRAWRLRSKYGLTPNDYMALLVEQGHACAICGQPERRKSRDGSFQPLSVDHDHSTGRVRGLLCARCNSVLGFIEQPTYLQAALDYLDSAGRPRLKEAS